MAGSYSDRDGSIWMDGKMIDWREANVHILTHAMHYASSVFEGERAYNGIFSFSRDVGNQSNIGVLYTQRDFVDDSNKVGSLFGRIDGCAPQGAVTLEPEIEPEGFAQTVSSRAEEHGEGRLHHREGSPACC